MQTKRFYSLFLVALATTVAFFLAAEVLGYVGLVQKAGLIAVLLEVVAGTVTLKLLVRAVPMWLAGLLNVVAFAAFRMLGRLFDGLFVEPNSMAFLAIAFVSYRLALLVGLAVAKSFRPQLAKA